MCGVINAIVQPDKRLAIVRELAAALDAAGLSYCHWKSNERLYEAVSGTTDLDILFAPDTRDAAADVLARTGFLRFSTAWQRRYPGIEDFIGIDPDTGRIVHVHAHFMLIVGESGLKSYRFPWEQHVLDRREWDEANQIYRSDAVSELVLLLVREAIKSNLRQGKRSQGKDRKPSGADREFAWLRQRVSSEALRGEATRLLGMQGSDAIQSLFEEGMSSERLVRLKKNIVATQSANRRYSPVGAWFALRVRSLAGRLIRYGRRLGMKGLVQRRTAAGKGLIVAFVGPDGAGKSTTVAAVAKELGRKVDVEQVYMGTGKGSAGLLRSAIQTLRLRKLGKPFKVLWAMSVALEKRSRLLGIDALRREGKIVVCDRYPQTDIEGYNDGPLLGRFRDSRFAPFRSIAKWERRCYGQAAEVAPDIVFRLNIGLDGLAQRRSTMNLELIRQKQSGFDRILFPARTNVVNLRSDQQLDSVILESMKEIGSALRSRVNETASA
jgi:thymidylate kinase